MLPQSGPGSGVGPADPEIVDSFRRLAAVFHDVLSEESPHALLSRIGEAFEDVLPHDALVIYWADDDEGELVPLLARDPFAEEMLATAVPLGQGVTGAAFEAAETVHVTRLDLDPHVLHVPGTPVELAALVSVPLVARGRAKGVLNLYRRGGADFDQHEVEVAQRIADAAALALDNAEIRLRLEHQARTDSLTGLYNQRTFHERLRAELSAGSASGDSVAVVMLDIDDFKRINDLHGHAAGDQVLAGLAAILRRTLRDSDLVCRIGGEEFAVILPRATSRRAEAIARRLLEAIYCEQFGTVELVTVSIGVAEAPLHATSGRELAACAEAAMMTAKSEGKNRVVVFAEELSERPQSGWEGRDARSLAHLRMAQSLLRKLGRLAELPEIGSVIVEELHGLLDHDGCGVYALRGEELSVIGLAGDPPDSVSCRMGEGLSGEAAASGAAVLRDRASGAGALVESALAVPLLADGRAIGAIAVSRLGPRRLDDHDVRLLEIVAGYAAVAVENARRHDEVTRRAAAAEAEARRLETALRATVEAVASMLEATGRRSLDAQLLARICALSARTAGCDPETLAALEKAARGTSPARRAA
jgi:diguanylate cyclase (GGDEF)-like protein